MTARVVPMAVRRDDHPCVARARPSAQRARQPPAVRATDSTLGRALSSEICTPLLGVVLYPAAAIPEISTEIFGIGHTLQSGMLNRHHQRVVAAQAGLAVALRSRAGRGRTSGCSSTPRRTSAR
eukprot:scaffold4556_cov114-Isochrysis_galbana.AAC.4